MTVPKKIPIWVITFIYLTSILFTLSCRDQKKIPKYLFKMSKKNWELEGYSRNGESNDDFKEFKIIYDSDDGPYMDVSISDSASYHNGHKRFMPYMAEGIIRFEFSTYSPTSEEELENQELMLNGFMELPEPAADQVSRRFKIVEVTNKKLILESGSSNYDNLESTYDTQEVDFEVERFEFKVL